MTEDLSAKPKVKRPKKDPRAGLHQGSTRGRFPPPDVDPPRSHWECPLCKFYVKRIWHIEDDGWGHHVFVCLKCGTELT